MDTQAAIAFIRSTGDPVEQAHLRYLLDREPPTPAIKREMFAAQRGDGGWSPFWATEYSLLDATCFPSGSGRAAWPHCQLWLLSCSAIRSIRACAPSRRLPGPLPG